MKKLKVNKSTNKLLNISVIMLAVYQCKTYVHLEVLLLIIMLVD